MHLSQIEQLEHAQDQIEQPYISNIRTQIILSNCKGKSSIFEAFGSIRDTRGIPGTSIDGGMGSSSHIEFPCIRSLSAYMGESQTEKNSVSAYGWGVSLCRIKHPSSLSL